MKKQVRNNNGITLVALVVTIIILLILTGVTVYFAINGGLLGKVEEAVDKSNTSGQNEVNTLDQATAQIDKYLGGTGGESTEPTIPEESLSKVEYEFDATSGTITGIKNRASYYETGTGYTLPGGDIAVIPSQIDGVAVKAIGNNVFEYSANITKVIIPNGVTTIGNNCFQLCNNLETVTIPESVTSLGDSCFLACSNLIRIVIPKGVTSIGASCFMLCSKLENVTISSGVTTMGNSCFSSCTSLRTITIPDSVTSLVWGCFNNCTNLTTITIPESVTIIDRYCFANCLNLTTINYTGTSQQWNDVVKGKDNGKLLDANMVYNYAQ